MKYFQWIEEFMRPRKSKTNLAVEENEHGKDESSEEEEEVVAKESDILSEVDGEESTSYSPNVTTSSEIAPINQTSYKQNITNHKQVQGIQRFAKTIQKEKIEDRWMKMPIP